VHAVTKDDAGPTLEAKVAFLSRPAAYAPRPAEVTLRETHMSWVFLAGERVYKLKKPVRFPYLDFSTIGRREQACRAELSLNRRLAPDVYLGVEPLTDTGRGLAIGGEGEAVDWLVCMTRLDERFMLENLINTEAVTTAQLDRLVATLTRFYRAATPVVLPPSVLIADLQRSLAYNKRVLLDARFSLPAGLVRRIDCAQRRFLARYGPLLAARLRHRRIVDGHGDLRPEHIWLDDQVRIIDCLEFNARLRAVDPFDEVAYLGMECERLGAGWIGDYLRRRMSRALRDGPAGLLFEFYTCHRATLRARLAIAHLLEPNPRTPEKWPRRAAEYLALAGKSARRLEALLRIPSGR
jgi:aminoglycoside phosphotransferase family enzyme